MKSIDVLGTPLAITSYEDLSAESRRLAAGDGTWAIDFTNTHIVTARRHDESFRELTNHFDLFVPDGMPLVWCLNRKKAGLNDRVYGPTFMRQFLESSSSSAKHFLIGGSEECGQLLRTRFSGVNFVGGFHGRCNAEGILEGPADEQVIADIQRLRPEFIWVGLGTPKQYKWIKRNRERIARGVFFSVGFAFDVNAGMKADAPVWMQKLGLTWLFRLLSEPRRLLSRYLRYNTLFVYYLLKGGSR